MKKSYEGKKSEGGSGGSLEDGEYTIKIFADEWKTTNAKDGKYLSVEFVGADKKIGKKHVWHNFGFELSNEKAVEISEEQFENLLYCLGLDSFKFKNPKKPSLKPLHGMIVKAQIETENPTKKEAKKKGYKPQLRIKYFLEAEGKKKGKKKGKTKKDLPF